MFTLIRCSSDARNTDIELCWHRQLFVGQEMGAAQEAPDRTGEGTRLEGVLGVSKGHHTAVLSVRLARGPHRRLGAQAPDHRGRCHYATHSGASATRLHLLSEHRIRRCVPVPGTVSGMCMQANTDDDGHAEHKSAYLPNFGALAQQVELENWVNSIHSACAAAFARHRGKTGTLHLLQEEIFRLEKAIESVSTRSI